MGKDAERLRKLFTKGIDDEEITKLADSIYKDKLSDEEIKTVINLFKAEDKESHILAKAMYEENEYMSLHPVIKHLYYCRINGWEREIKRTNNEILDILQYEGEFVVFG